jgi:SAM-dependent methyltransferase
MPWTPANNVDISDMVRYMLTFLSGGGGIVAPWVPTRDELIPYIMYVTRPRNGDIFYDLGCGDGRVAIEAALRGAKTVCVEINKELISKAQERAKRMKVYDKIEFINDSFFNINLNDATIVYMYLLTSVNRMLKPKLKREVKMGCKIATLDFEIPGWRPIHIMRVSLGYRDATIYLYKKGISDLYDEVV